MAYIHLGMSKRCSVLSFECTWSSRRTVVPKLIATLQKYYENGTTRVCLGNWEKTRQRKGNNQKKHQAEQEEMSTITAVKKLTQQKKI